jgi:hypothetical protein
VTAPTNGASTIAGAWSTAKIEPAQALLLVRSQASHSVPIRCIQSVTSAGVIPPMKQAQLRCFHTPSIGQKDSVICLWLPPARWDAGMYRFEVELHRL